ncbi:MAG: DPP IV N-terminal domain-containing protein [Dysgonamonadaceae bacterium]|jgi:dipeptidyl-peptidase-4|nr:DPP IV N-terminal domain-containing protein [Dysgonamonadaceae bacterium]
MTVRKTIFFIFIAFAGALSAQQNGAFTLEDLIPGGKTFYNFYPRIPAQYQWYGDKLVCVKGDSVFISENPDKPQNRSLLFTLGDLQQKSGDKNTRISNVVFPQKGTLLQYFTSKGIGIYDLKSGQPESFFAYPEGSANHELDPQNQHLAYTKGNNLFLLDANGTEIAVSNESDKGIVYGQSVHRNEFGIYKGIFWSPDGQKLAFYRMDETMVTDYPLVDVSARIATLKDIKYPMAGMKSHEVTVGVYDVRSGNTVYLETGEPKEKYLTNVAWSPDGSKVYIAELNREQNHLKMARYDTASGKLETTLFEESHPKYVEPEHPALFIPGNTNRFIWQSKRDGHNHLYLYDASGKFYKQLTKGDWDVTDVFGFDEKGEKLFFASTKPTPMDRQVYAVGMKNEKIEALTSVSGTHSGHASASGRYFIDRFSANDNPGEVFLIDTRKKNIQTIASAKNPYKGFAVPTVESGTIKAADNKTDLFYRMVKPADFDPSKKYPVIVYVYGGPHSQLVANRWRYGSGGWEMYMAQKGYLVFVMDNRGTSNRGFDFENVTHRRLGVEEGKDQIRGVEFLKSLPYIDGDRIGVHGWSYGGFMTISLLLDYPDVFKVGVAGGPVIDWKYYEVMYGERYMDRPQENPDGYEKTSLLNKAGNLKSRLLIIHGDEDPTVVWQNSLMFLKSCIGAGTHPDYFVYPGHGHNMTGHDRVHLHEHITRYFEDFMPQAEK